jgi:hypothetical protein
MNTDTLTQGHIYVCWTCAVDFFHSELIAYKVATCRIICRFVTGPFMLNKLVHLYSSGLRAVAVSHSFSHLLGPQS